MWLMEKFISWICDCFYDLCAALMDLMSSAMMVFIPNEGTYGIPNILTSEDGFAFDFMAGGYSVILSLAFALVCIKFTFNLLSDLKPGFSSAREEGLFSHIGRFILALALVGSSYRIIDWMMGLGAQLAYCGFLDEKVPTDIGTALTTSVAAHQNSASGVGSGLTRTAFIPLVIIIAITWNQLKLFVEIAERLITTTLITMFAPLGFCTPVSQDWQPIGKRYLQMVFSSYLVIYVNIFFMRCAFQGMMFTMSEKGVLSSNGLDMYTWRLMAVLAILIVAQKADRIIRDSGLAVSQTGGQLFGSIAGVIGAGMMLGRGAARDRRDRNRRRPAGQTFGFGGGVARGAGVHHGTQSRANQIMRNAIGAESASSLFGKGKNMSFERGEGCYINAKSNNGRMEVNGSAVTRSGKNVNFATDPTGTGANINGNGCIDAGNGVLIPVWGDGARDALTPNGRATLGASVNNVAEAEGAANEILSKAITEGGGVLPEGKVEEAASAARAQLFSDARSAADVKESVRAGEAMLNPVETSGKTMVGAWHDEGEPEGLFHAMAIDNTTGEICSYDIASSVNAERIEGLHGREADSKVKTDVGTMQAYRTTLSLSSANTSSLQFTDMDNRKLSLGSDRVVATDIPGVYQRQNKVTYEVKSKDSNGNEKTSTATKYVTSGHWVPSSKYSAPKNAERMKINGQEYTFIASERNNKMSSDKRGDNGFINAVRSVFRWKR